MLKFDLPEERWLSPSEQPTLLSASTRAGLLSGVGSRRPIGILSAWSTSYLWGQCWPPIYNHLCPQCELRPKNSRNATGRHSNARLGVVRRLRLSGETRLRGLAPGLSPELRRPFRQAHRAVDDCHPLLEILAFELPMIGKPALAVLLEQARKNTMRVWAEQ